MHHFESLTSLRFLAALWVIALHYVPGSPLTDAGYLGVALFFVLSGFVIAHVYGEMRTPYLQFLWFRFARIWPVHALVLFVLAGAMVGNLMEPRPEHSLTNFGLSLLMVHAWGLTRELSWNYPSWSISAEWAAYIAFPFIWPLTMRWPAAAATATCASWLFIAHGGTPEDIRWTLAQVACQFTLGCSIYALYLRRIGEGFAWSAIVAGCFVVILSAPLIGLADPWLTPIFALLILGLAYERGLWARLLGARGMIFLGRASYSIYLLHLPVYLALRDFGIYVCLTTTLALAGITYIVFENPTRRFLRDLGNRRKPAL